MNVGEKKEEVKQNVCLKCSKVIHEKLKFCMDCGIMLDIRKNYPHNSF